MIPIPITRKDLYLNKIVGNDDYSVPEKPISEEESFFAEILGEAVQAPEPLTRYQMYLAKIAKRDVEIPYPKTRLEYFLAKAAGMDITVPIPITREEIYWSNYTAVMEFEVENVPPLTYKAIEGTLKNYRIYGNTVTVEEKNIITVNWEQGTIISGSGELAYSTTRVRSEAIPVDPNTTYTVKATTPNDKVLDGWLLGYDVNNVKTIRYPLPAGEILYPSWQYPITFTTSADTAYVRLVAKYANDSEINIQPVTELYVGNKDYYGVEHYCGDRTANLFDKNNYKFLRAGFRNGKFDYDDFRYVIYIPLSEGKTYTITKPLTDTFQLTQSIDEPVENGTYFINGKSTFVNIYEVYGYNTISHTITTISLANYLCIGCFSHHPTEAQVTALIEGLQIEENDHATEYEPYGYRVPVTVTNGTDTLDALTTNIYLPEQIRKVGDEAEYVDYQEQKQHFADGTSADVELPALPTIAGTNTLSVGTTVQPSEVEIKGKIKAVQEGGGQDES